MGQKPNQHKVVVLVGPTAVGKSSLAISLAKKYNGEVISADSRQVYTGLDIGTGKVTTEEMDGVPHHLLDVVDPKIQFTASDFRELGRKAIDDIHARGKLPIICGGTGMYIDAVLGSVFVPEVPPNEALRAELSLQSTEELFTQLSKLDPRRAQTIDKNNSRRLIRAIEIARAIGSVPTPSGSDPLYTEKWIGLTLPLPELKERIHARLLSRMEDGMVDEVRRLHEQGLSYARMEALGLEYRYLARLLQELLTEDEMLRLLEIEIVHYAKRQMVWFKKNAKIQWFDPSHTEKIEKEVEDFL